MGREHKGLGESGYVTRGSEDSTPGNGHPAPVWALTSLVVGPGSSGIGHVSDPVVLARWRTGDDVGQLHRLEDAKLGTILHTGIVPQFPESPGTIRWTGPDIGEHGAQILSELAGMDDEAITKLRQDGVTA